MRVDLATKEFGLAVGILNSRSLLFLFKSDDAMGHQSKVYRVESRRGEASRIGTRECNVVSYI